LENQTGNTVLLAFTGENQYLHVGAWTFTFTTNEPIIEFRSPLGNNAVPYALAHSENFWYIFGIGLSGNFVLPKKSLPKNLQKVTDDFDQNELWEAAFAYHKDAASRHGSAKSYHRAIDLTREILLPDFCLVLPRRGFDADA